MAFAQSAAVKEARPLWQYLKEIAETDGPPKLPIPMFNVLNGGRHADNNLSIQEFMIVPLHKQFSERVRMGSQIFHSLAAILNQKGLSTAVGDEGGFAPDLLNNERALQLLVQAIKSAGFVPGKHVFISLDMAASEFFRHGRYYFESKKQGYTAEKMMRVLEGWIKKYPLLSVEDGLAEDDWENWAILTKQFGKKLTLIGDDLFVTNTKRLQKGITEKVANAILIKVNQIGTLSETIDAIYLAKKNNYKVSVSHRSGETADTFIADLAVAVNAEFIKSGSMSRSERVEKYNRLMKIESECL